MIVFLFSLGLAYILYTYFSTENKRKELFKKAEIRQAAHGPFTIGYIYYGQGVATNANADFFIIVGSTYLGPSPYGNTKTYEASFEVPRSQLLRITYKSVSKNINEKQSNLDTSSYDLLIDGPNSSSIKPITVNLNAYARHIDPWINTVFGFEAKKYGDSLDIK